MAARYEVGQKVKVRPVKSQQLSPRDSDIKQYAGQTGTVVDFYWISLDRGAKIFYIYTIEIDENQKEVVVHEDELEPYLI